MVKVMVVPALVVTRRIIGRRFTSPLEAARLMMFVLSPVPAWAVARLPG
jgi:hypothetical protein